MTNNKKQTFRPFFSYFGAKYRNAKLYPEPLHGGVIIEPFAGSAGYSVRHLQNGHQNVILCEKNPTIANIWKYLIQVSPERILSLPDINNDQTVDDLHECTDVEKELIGFWLNRATTAPTKSPSKWMRKPKEDIKIVDTNDQMHLKKLVHSNETPIRNDSENRIYAGSFWGTRVKNTIASQVDFIRNWKVYECSYEELLEQIDIDELCRTYGITKDKITWYIDPPYQKAGIFYTSGFNSKCIDFEHLGSWCKSLPGRVIVCENEGADWLDFTYLADIKTTRKGRRSHEVIWTNFVRDCDKQISLFK